MLTTNGTATGSEQTNYSTAFEPFLSLTGPRDPEPRACLGNIYKVVYSYTFIYQLC